MPIIYMNIFSYDADVYAQQSSENPSDVIVTRPQKTKSRFEQFSFKEASVYFTKNILFTA